MKKLLIKDEELESAVSVFSALGSTNRLQIVMALEDGEMSVSQLSETVGCRISCISQHLSVLKSARIVSARRDGHEVFYSISKPCVTTFLSCLINGNCGK